MAIDLTNPPMVVANDPDTIFMDLKGRLETILQSAPYNMTGYTIYEGEPLYAMLKMLQYLNVSANSEINSAVLDTLVAFAQGAQLDYLGDNKNVSRLPASASVTTITMTLVPGHGVLTIPAGMRIASTDGQVVFTTDADTVVGLGVNSIDVNCTCDTTGTAGNGYIAGTITQILDPQPYLTAASNSATTSGGADIESDDAYRLRVRLGNASDQKPGTDDGYRYLTLSVSSSIIDVYVTSLYGGQADIYVLMNNLQPTSTAILADVETACTSVDVKELCDTVVAHSPIRIDYSLTVGLTLYSGQNATDAITAVTNALTTYTQAAAQKLGTDILLSELIKLAKIDNVVYNPDFGSFADIVVDADKFAVCGAITVTVTGYNQG